MQRICTGDRDLNGLINVNKSRPMRYHSSGLVPFNLIASLPHAKSDMCAASSSHVHNVDASCVLPSSSSLNEQFQRMWHQRERDYLPHPLNKNTRTKREKKRKVGVLFCATIAFMFGVYLYVIGHKLSELFLYMNWTRAVGDIDNHNNNKATSARPMMLLLKI